MPDTPENQAAYPQVYNQKSGLGFLIARVGALISLSCGTILHLGVCKYAGKGQGEVSCELAAALADLNAKRSLNARRNLIIVRLACCCGPRVSEIAQLRLDDVVLTSRRPHLALRAATTSALRVAATGREIERPVVADDGIGDVQVLLRRSFDDDPLGGDEDLGVNLPKNGGRPDNGVDSPWEVHHGQKATKLYARVQARSS